MDALRQVLGLVQKINGVNIFTLATFASLGVIVALGIALFFAIDRCFLMKYIGLGKVIRKNLIPANVYPVPLHNLSMGLLESASTFSVSEWLAVIEVNGRQGSVSIPSDLFNHLKIGQMVEVEYMIGRLFGKLYIRHIEL